MTVAPRNCALPWSSATTSIGPASSQLPPMTPAWSPTRCKQPVSPSLAHAISTKRRYGNLFASSSIRSRLQAPTRWRWSISPATVQFKGENYFVPVEADIARDVDVPLEAIRISDFTQPLAVLPGHVKIVILDAARQNPFACGGEPFASVLALVDPPRDRAVAFNAAPGTVAPDEQSPYGAYATALTEMIAAGGLTLDDTFARVRLRVSDVTQGVEIPWYASQTQGPFFMTERVAGAPPPPNFVPLADIRNRPMRDFGGVEDANAAALAIDTIAGYEQFLSLYPNSPYSRRVAAMLAVRREAIVWRRCVIADTPPAYWSYLRRYPRGPHAWDARRRLAMLRAEFEPPPDFAVYDFGMPPPPPFFLSFCRRGRANSPCCRRHHRRASASFCRLRRRPPCRTLSARRERWRCGRFPQEHRPAFDPPSLCLCRRQCSRTSATHQVHQERLDSIRRERPQSSRRCRRRRIRADRRRHPRRRRTHL